MKESYSLHNLVRNFLILLLLFVLILAPRPILGELDLASAVRFGAAAQYTQAASAYVSAAQRLPWLPGLWEKAGDAYLQANDYYRSDYAYVQALERHALSPNGYMHWGDAAFARGDPRFAVDLWNELLQNGGDASILLGRIAYGYKARSNYSAEIQAWQKYLLHQPKDAAARYRLGLLLAASSPEDALPDLVQAASLDSSLDASVQSLRSALNTAFLSDDRAYQLLVSGRALGTAGEWRLAGEAFHNAIAARPEYAEAWAWLAEAEQQQDQDGTAEIEKARRLNPDSAMVQSLYGLYLQRQKQPVKALAAFQIAALLEPENPGWQMALGGAFEQTDDLVAALEHYQRAVQLAPEAAPVWRALADFSLRDSVDPTGIGLPAARRLVELASDDWQSVDIAGQIILETGDLPGAEALLNKAIELDPTQAAPFLHLGLLYLQTGNRPAAYSHLIQARDFDPDGTSGWQAGRLLEQYFP